MATTIDQLINDFSSRFRNAANVAPFDNPNHITGDFSEQLEQYLVNRKNARLEVLYDIQGLMTSVHPDDIKKIVEALCHQVHGLSYTYEHMCFDNLALDNKVYITCPKHGDFALTIFDHLVPPDGYIVPIGCQECLNEAISNRAVTTSIYIAETEIVHLNDFDYSLVNYSRSLGDLIKESTGVNSSNITIQCVECRDAGRQHILLLIPSNHRVGKGCIYCSNHKKKPGDLAYRSAKFYRAKQLAKYLLDNKVSKKWTNDEMQARTDEVHGAGRFDLSKTTYNGWESPFTIRCITCSERDGEDFFFSTTPKNHYNPRTKGCCPECQNNNFFDMDCPACLYYIRIYHTDTNKYYYKIGVTTRTIRQRMLSMDIDNYDVIMTKDFRTGREALRVERFILNNPKYSDYKYVGPNILEKRGNTELFTCDILNLDTSTHQ